jgi:hypothetical protein
LGDDQLERRRPVGLAAEGVEATFKGSWAVVGGHDYGQLGG